MKKTPDVLPPKARPVACGFEENCLNKIDIELPTWSKDSLGTILVATAQNN